ncbi:hypothetical protein SLAVM298S_00218 [Streptomyces lavendulae subsp. lavendulae]
MSWPVGGSPSKAVFRVASGAAAQAARVVREPVTVPAPGESGPDESAAVQGQGQRLAYADVSEGALHVGDVDVDGAEALAEVEGAGAAGAQPGVALGGDQVAAVDLAAEHGVGAGGGVGEDAEYGLLRLGLRAPVVVEAVEFDRLALVPGAELEGAGAGEAAGGAVVLARRLDAGLGGDHSGGRGHVLGELGVGLLEGDGDLERAGLGDRGDVLEDLGPGGGVVGVHLTAEAEHHVVGGHLLAVVEAHAGAQVVHPGGGVRVGRLLGETGLGGEGRGPAHQALAHVGQDGVLRVVEGHRVVEGGRLRVHGPAERVDLAPGRRGGRGEVGVRDGATPSLGRPRTGREQGEGGQDGGRGGEGREAGGQTVRPSARAGWGAGHRHALWSVRGAGGGVGGPPGRSAGSVRRLVRKRRPGVGARGSAG